MVNCINSWNIISKYHADEPKVIKITFIQKEKKKKKLPQEHLVLKSQLTKFPQEKREREKTTCFKMFEMSHCFDIVINNMSCKDGCHNYMIAKLKLMLAGTHLKCFFLNRTRLKNQCFRRRILFIWWRILNITECPECK